MSIIREQETLELKLKKNLRWRNFFIFNYALNKKLLLKEIFFSFETESLNRLK
ncbi:hypothetical protein LCGC14_1874490 [marine sediment metagenome]|uniref:Uncharacterized protein n=1 Tax=marine sediment metagenome TaxID=412755 RepID=A0A0F9G470_9ZZZZ